MWAFTLHSRWIWCCQSEGKLVSLTELSLSGCKEEKRRLDGIFDITALGIEFLLEKGYIIVSSMSLVDVIVMLVIFLVVYYFQYDFNGNSYKLYCKKNI